MSCFHPLTAYWKNAARDGITFDASRSLTKISFSLPCGRCIGCRMERARQWGLRCLHEAKMWPENSYVTLTYDDEFLPPGGTVVLRDVQLFMKRLRKARKNQKIRFFLGAEYGETNRRPHYHALLFNCGFSDKKLWRTNARGENLYVSDTLRKIWGMGHCSIGDVTFDSAVYCAKYALKSIKISENSSDEARQAYLDRYEVFDDDGVVYERAREFAVMSRRPGIGALYYEKYGKEVRDHDSVVVNGREVRPARFYDGRTKLHAPEVLERLKRKRKRMAVLNKHDNTPDRLRVKETLAIIAAEKKERKL